MQETTVTMGAVRAATAWVLATLAIFGGTIALFMEHDALALCFYAHSMLFIGAACVLTIQCTVHRTTQSIINGLGIHEDSAKLRRLS